MLVSPRGVPWADVWRGWVGRLDGLDGLGDLDGLGELGSGDWLGMEGGGRQALADVEARQRAGI